MYFSRMSADILLILCTCPDRTCAESIANHLVDGGIAACVNITAAVTSVYRWQGQRESAEEILLLIKTSSSRYPAVENTIRAMHPYELPEIVAVPVEKGLPDYLRWIEQCTKTDS
jgi:periplasmic divalent cation tolerance protein